LDKQRIIIIGAGPAGYVAAIRAAQLGAEVVLIEKEEIGGTCLNRGCIPTKSLLNSSKILNLVRNVQEFGIEVENINFNFHQMMERKNKIVHQVIRGVHYLLDYNKVKLIKGKASFLNSQEIEVKTDKGEEKIKGKKIIIATGSEPSLIPNIDISHPLILTSREILELKELPETLLIVGGGVIGCEFAYIFNELGVKITIAEMMEHILPMEDKRISLLIERTFHQKGIEIFTKTKLKKIKEYGEKIKAELDNGKEITIEKALICTGRKPKTHNLHLENTGLRINPRGYILVNKKMQTNVSGIYAAGDVTGEPLLAHKSFAEGIVAAENALGTESLMDYSAIPNCIFTSPEIGSVGLTIDKAREKGIKIKVGRFSFSNNGKAQIQNETAGFVQLIAEEKNGKILGGQIVGPEATNLIHEIVLAIRWGLTLENMGNTFHAHPTLSEVIIEAARSALKKPIHSI